VAHPTQAVLVTAFVHTLLAPRVLVLEGALATANRQMLGGFPQEETATLARALSQEAHLLTGVSPDLTVLMPPQVGALPTIQVARLIEDLALVGDDLASVLQQIVTAVSGTPMGEEASGGPEDCVAYTARIRHAVASLQRAEGWLETIDQETGAHVTLPGFERGGRALESQLALQ
jgi:hypothetical protein